MNVHHTSIISKEAKIGKNVFIGPFSNLQKKIAIGNNTKIFGLFNAYDCNIGANCKIGTFVELQSNVTIGNNCKIQSHTFICEGVNIEDGVSVAHGVIFVNDKMPRAITKRGRLKAKGDWDLLRTKVCFGASIGSGAIILPVKIGKWAMIGAGAIVTDDVPDFGLVYGAPARLKGFVCKCGAVLKSKREKGSYMLFKCSNCSESISIKRELAENL